MTREEAIKIIRDTYHTDTELEALKVLVPELKESEDEKIRKSLLAYIKGESKRLDTGKWIAWLEKQKERPKSADSISSDCTKDAKCDDRSQKHNISVDEIAQDYIDGVKEYNPDPTWLLMQNAVCYGYNYREQKEQKPVEWSEEDENALEYVQELIGFGLTENFFDAQTASDMREWLNTRLKSLRPQSKVEEEPEEDLEKVAEEYANKEHPDEPCVGKWGTGDYEPPIDREYDREIAKDAFKAGIRWMEERGKTNNYKPTKEQIEYLSKAILTLGEEGDGKTAAVLNELRKDLKNL